MDDTDAAALAPVLERVAERLIEHRFQCWFYGDSIGFEGLIAASHLFGRPRWFDFSRGFFRAWATRMEPFQPDDNTAPGHAMCEMVAETGDAILREAVLKLADHLAGRRRIGAVSVTFEDCHRSLRAPYGNLAMSAEDERILADPGAGIYVDCLHFDPPFFAHLARLTGEAQWAERAVAEAIGYGDILFDEPTGTYRHFWLERTGRAYAAGWGRGQGWALLGLLDVIASAPAGTPGLATVRERAAALADTMRGYQRDDGDWYNVVHEPRSGNESSTAAFMATAFYRGVTLGIFDAARFVPAADKAWAAVCRNLAGNGDLRGVTAAVYSSTLDEHYWHVPTNQIVPWGQGPVLTAAAARAALDRSATTVERPR